MVSLCAHNVYTYALGHNAQTGIRYIIVKVQFNYLGRAHTHTHATPFAIRDAESEIEACAHFSNKKVTRKKRVRNQKKLPTKPYGVIFTTQNISQRNAHISFDRIASVAHFRCSRFGCYIGASACVRLFAQHLCACASRVCSKNIHKRHSQQGWSARWISLTPRRVQSICFFR